MKTLIVYYSYEGNTKLIAEKMANSINADIMELKPINEKKTKGFMKYVWGGRAAMMNKKPDLEPLEFNLDDYEQIIFGTPVWAGTFAPPLNTIFANNKLENKNVALFCCHAGGKGKIFNKFDKIMSGNRVVGQLDIVDPLKSNADEKVFTAIGWVNALPK